MYVFLAPNNTCMATARVVVTCQKKENKKGSTSPDCSVSSSGQVWRLINSRRRNLIYLHIDTNVFNYSFVERTDTGATHPVSRNSFGRAWMWVFTPQPCCSRRLPYLSNTTRHNRHPGSSHVVSCSSSGFGKREVRSNAFSIFRMPSLDRLSIHSCRAILWRSDGCRSEGDKGGSQLCVLVFQTACVPMSCVTGVDL